MLMMLVSMSTSFAAPGDVINTSNRSVYNITTDAKAVEELVSDLNNGEEGNLFPIEGISDNFLQEQDNGQYINPFERYQARKSALAQLLADSGLDLGDKQAVEDYLKSNMPQVEQAIASADSGLARHDVNVAEWVHAEDTDENSVEVSESAKVFSQEESEDFVSSVVDVQVNESGETSFALESMPESAEELETGDIFIVNPGGSGEVFIGKVKSIEQEEVGASIVASAPRLEEVFSDFDISVSQRISSSDIVSSRFINGVSLEDSGNLSSFESTLKQGFNFDQLYKKFLLLFSHDEAPDISLGIDNAVIYDGDGDSETEDDQLVINGSIELNDASIDFDCSGKNFMQDRLYARFTATPDVNIALSGKLSETVSLEDFKSQCKEQNLKPAVGSKFAEGVDINDKVVLGSIAVNLGTLTPVCKLGEPEPISTQLTAAILFTCSLEGTISAQITSAFNWDCYLDRGFDFRRDGLAYYLEKEYNVFADGDCPSRNVIGAEPTEEEKSTIPDVDWSIAGNGEKSISAKIGTDVALYVANIIPAMIENQFITKTNVTGSFSIEDDGIFNEASGSVDVGFESSILARLKFAGDSWLTDKITFEYSKKLYENTFFHKEFQEGKRVDFPDPYLEAAVRRAINKYEGDIFKSDVEKITELHLDDATNLEGIQYLTNLECLYYNGNQLSDITPLANLTNLRELHMSRNQISDISPLVNLTKLEMLGLNNNRISDISPIAKLNNLFWLDLTNNQISDISALANLSKLQYVYLDSNQISDISALAKAELNNLQYLNFGGNQISDISPLANLNNLQELQLACNQISDISPLANLTNLGGLYLYANQISDISPLANLTNLGGLDIARNQISDISPLSNLINLRSLYLSGNQITDYSPVFGYYENIWYIWRDFSLSSLDYAKCLMGIGDYYNAVVYAGMAIDSGYEEGSYVMAEAAKELADAAYYAYHEGDKEKANSYYQLLSVTSGVPEQIRIDAINNLDWLEW